MICVHCFSRPSQTAPCLKNASYCDLSSPRCVRDLRGLAAHRCAFLAAEEPGLHIVDWTPGVAPATRFPFQLTNFEFRVLLPKLWVVERKGNVTVAIVAVLIFALWVLLGPTVTSLACVCRIGVS